MSDGRWADLTGETRDIWEQNASFWDDYVGEGNQFHRLLVAPATERLLAIRPDEVVLDIACGNGSFSRRLAELGAQVVAFDFSATFIERARARTIEYAERIEYRVADATDREQLLALGARRFDAAVSNMALMDMPTIDPLLAALSQLLKPGGRFVFSVMHPCFNSYRTIKVVEEDDRDGQLVTNYTVKVSAYSTPTAFKGLGIIGQPAPHYYFHRPISLLLNSAFGAGFVLDGIEEPVFGSDANPSRPFSWSNYKEIPPALVVRLRLLGQP
ncbi:MAG TPA: class I SAM-dependent methyltransferase [Ardenticatenaceae bacterium]|nr:class I SAM-dependent methyltransferase [Ardenticatenaceae bacterium]